VLTSVIGGLLGAISSLKKTPAHTFMRVLPWLMLGATLLFRLRQEAHPRRPSGLAHDASTAALVGASVFSSSSLRSNGGYFVGGVGIMNRPCWQHLGMTDIHAMNALKCVMGGVINGSAVVAFIAQGGSMAARDL